MIGNDKTGWRLYSKNGTTVLTGACGPSNKHPESGVRFNSLAEFANSSSNFDPETGEVTYTGAFRITTSEEVDVKMREAAAEQVGSWYDVTGTFSGSCIDVCSDALEAGGLDPGNETYYNGKTGEPYESQSPILNKRYEAIVKNNKGVDVTKDIQPSEASKKKYKGEATEKQKKAEGLKAEKRNRNEYIRKVAPR